MISHRKVEMRGTLTLDEDEAQELIEALVQRIDHLDEREQPASRVASLYGRVRNVQTELRSYRRAHP